MEYNKTFLIKINKDLAVRLNALPVLQSKEAALRAETKKMRARLKELDAAIEDQLRSLLPISRFWAEFPDLVKLKQVKFTRKKFASINVNTIDEIIFEVEDFSLFAAPSWFMEGVEILKKVIKLKIERLNEEKILKDIELARRKTTQKVNLYEKVQIPMLNEMVRKIKRFLEDEENLSKASQKVIKKRMHAQVAV